MATVRLSDAIVPDVFLSYEAVNSPEITALMQSGVIASSATLDRIARNGGLTVTMPFWNDLDASIEENYSNDDPEDMATPLGITADIMRTRKAFINQGWAAMRLVAELTGSDPMARIRARTDAYFERRKQRRIIALLNGVMAANLAKNDGDMVIDVSELEGDAGRFTNHAVIDASQTSGDASNFRAILMHSAIRTAALKRNEIEYVRESDTGLTLEYYKGLRVVVDDNTPSTGTGADRVYTSILLGGGAFGFGGAEGTAIAEGEGTPQLPVEVDSTPRSGNGGGGEELWVRKTWLLHPNGYSWLEPTGEAGDPALTEFSPTVADLQNANRWRRVVDRKQVPLAFLRSRA